MRSRGFLLLLCLVFLPGVAPAGERDDLFLALDLERGSGRFEDALTLYRKVAEEANPGIAASARLGMVRCLRLLGRSEEARHELDRLLAGNPPAEIRTAADAERARLAKASEAGPDPAAEASRLREELVEVRAEVERLRQSLQNEEGSREELAKKLKEKEALVEDLNARLAGLGKPDESAQREADRQKRLADREELAAYWLSLARVRYREGRFDEALELADKALELDPANGEARELRGRLGDAPSGQDHLVREVLKLLDLVRKLRFDDLRAEIDARLAAGEDLLLRGHPDEAVARFTECMALVDSAPSFAPDLSLRRTKAKELLDRAVLRGGHPGAVVPALPRPGNREKVAAELEDLLAKLASTDRPGGGLLRVYPLETAPAPKHGEPPPGKLAASPRRPEPGPLYRDLIPRLVHPTSWQKGGQFVRDLGDALVVYAPAEVHEGVSTLLRRISARQDLPVRISIRVLACDPARLADLSRTAGVRFGAQGNAGLAEPSGAAADALRKALLDEGHAEELGSLVLPGAAGDTAQVVLYRSVNLSAPQASPGDPELRRLDYGLTVDLLPVRDAGSLGLSVEARVSSLRETLSLPGVANGDLKVPTIDAETVRAAARLPADGSMVLTGFANPFSVGRAADHRVLVLFFRPEGTTPAAEAPAPAAAEGPPPVPVDLAGLDVEPVDEPAPPFKGERSRAEASRSGFLLRYLWEELGADLGNTDATFTPIRGVLWVHGDEAFVERVKEIVSTLAATRDKLLTLKVRAATLSPAEEGRLLSGLPSGGTVIEGKGVRTFVLPAEDLESSGLRYFLSGTDGRIPLPETVTVRPTQLVNLTRVVRSSFHAGDRSGRSGETWPEYSEVDEGVEIELRALVRADGEFDLRTGVRVARVLSRSPEDSAGSSPEGPVQTISVARARARLAAGQGLLISGLPAPTPVVGRRDRMVVLVTAAGSKPR